MPHADVAAVVTAAVGETLSRLRATHAGYAVIGIEDAADVSGPRIIVGDPEQWRAQWALTQTVRTTGEMLIAAECQSELRQLAGVRDLPPFARQHAGRAWVTGQGTPPRRVLIVAQPRR